MRLHYEQRRPAEEGGEGEGTSSFQKIVAVEAAHMELASPSISDAFTACVDKGAVHIICHPYFLSSAGRHMREDIPQLLRDSQAKFPNVTYDLTPCIGDYQDAMLQIITHSIDAQDVE